MPIPKEIRGWARIKARLTWASVDEVCGSLTWRTRFWRWILGSLVLVLAGGGCTVNRGRALWGAVDVEGITLGRAGTTTTTALDGTKEVTAASSARGLEVVQALPPVIAELGKLASDPDFWAGIGRLLSGGGVPGIASTLTPPTWQQSKRIAIARAESNGTDRAWLLWQAELYREGAGD